MKIVIVGGAGGGATAAARLRRLSEEAEIVLFEKSGFVSYANCGLPYFIGGKIQAREDLLLQTPESLRARYKIDVHVHHEVKKINRKTKTVTVENIKTGECFAKRYDKLILSPGAVPVLPPFYKDAKNVFTLRTVEDTLKIRAFADENAIRTACVIGGGFIGLEMAENLQKRGVQVTIVQRSAHLLGSIDADMAAFVHNYLNSRGIRILLHTHVESLSEAGVITDNGTVEADMILVSAGVTPESTLAREAGLPLGEKGAICVSSAMQTEDADIYAIGDAAEVENFITGEKTVIPLAGPANKQGRIAADAICGMHSTYPGTHGASVIKLFDMTVATAGMTEEKLQKSGISFEKVILSPLSHAGYYPGATALTLKVLFEKETYTLLGAQCIGFEGVEKRIDVLATAIFAGLPADRLRELELTYAPPYSSAKDPVNMAGFIIDNIKNGIVKQFYYADIASLQNRTDVCLLDTRTVPEYERGHAEGFINIPLDTLRENLARLDREKPVYVMCQSGMRSYLATRILVQNGFEAYNFAGGYRLYNAIKKDAHTSYRTYPCGMEK